jgi:hypothetical protein
LALGSCFFASCISAEFNRNSELIPINPAAMQPLIVGESTLTECLAALGAPLHVWEIDTGACLAWYWIDKSDWGVTLAVPASDAISANLSYGESSEDIEGLVLFFDNDWTLTSKRTGLISEIVPARRRPADLTGDDEPAVRGELDVEAAGNAE